MLRHIELLYLLTINVMAPQFLKTLSSVFPAMHSRFWALVVFFVVLQCMNVFQMMQNRTLLWRITYGVLITLNIAAFTFLTQLSVFSTPIAVLEIIGSMQM
ncbi:MAG: hypothetical protein ACON45_03785 [Paracoccaceae bacterium]